MLLNKILKKMGVLKTPPSYKRFYPKGTLKVHVTSCKGLKVADVLRLCAGMLDESRV